MSDIWLRLLVMTTAAVQIVVPFFVNPFRDGANPVRNPEPSGIEPAGYAFAIWGVIYAAALAYAFWQLTETGRGDEATRRIAPLAITLYVGSSLWLWVAAYGPLWATMPILAVMAAAATASLLLAIGSSEGGAPAARYWLMIAPFALYAGWTVCATFVNIAEVAPRYGFMRFGLSTTSYAVLSLVLAALLAAGVLVRARGEPALAATVIWALVAIAVASRQRGHDPAITITAAAAAVSIGILTTSLRFASRSV